MVHLRNKEKITIINALRKKYPLFVLLKKLFISKSSYCYQNRIISSDKHKDVRIKIASLFHENKARYGYRRIHALLKTEGLVISEKTVRKIMREESLFVKVRKAGKNNSYQGEISEEVSNVINRNFHADKPNTKTLTDITEFSISAGKVYLSSLINCFDGMVACWTVSQALNAELTNTMLINYFLTLKNHEKPLIHSDRGVHYRWPEWIKIISDNGFARSMSKKGCSFDKSACEGFFGHMKNEMFYDRNFQNYTIEDFIDTINEYIIWYNNTRIKQSLNFMSPMEYRRSLGLI